MLATELLKASFQINGVPDHNRYSSAAALVLASKMQERAHLATESALEVFCPDEFRTIENRRELLIRAE